MALIEDPLLTWATGLQTTDRRIYAGWMAEAGRDDALDAAMTEAGMEAVTIKHGNGNIVRHWALPAADLFPVAIGVPREGRAGDPPPAPTGLVYAWTTKDDGRQVSKLRLRVLVRALCAVGYTEPLLVALTGTITSDFRKGLFRQYDVLAAYKATKAEGAKVPFYAFSIPTIVGPEVTRGKTATKQITVMQVVIPEKRAIDQTYLRSHWIGRKDLVETIEALMEPTLAWAEDTRAQLAAGTPIREADDDAPPARPAGRNVPQPIESDDDIPF